MAARRLPPKRSKRRRPAWQRPHPKKWRDHPFAQLRYDENGGGMSPFLVGMAAAEFLPADPAAWFDAALDAELRFVGSICARRMSSKARSRRFATARCAPRDVFRTRPRSP